jgi:hypothetical protein
LPVKNGWQAEKTSICISPPWVERVSMTLPQLQVARSGLYFGWIFAFMAALDFDWFKGPRSLVTCQRVRKSSSGPAFRSGCARNCAETGSTIAPVG